jgi:hypothetical protein
MNNSVILKSETTHFADVISEIGLFRRRVWMHDARVVLGLAVLVCVDKLKSIRSLQIRGTAVEAGDVNIGRQRIVYSPKAPLLPACANFAQVTARSGAD